MAELFGIVVSAGQALETAIAVVQNITQAYERQKEQLDFLNRYRIELLAIKEQIERIERVNELATSSVLSVLLRLKDPEERLVKWLTKVDRGGKKAFRRFVEQLVVGDTERKKLEGIFSELTRLKLDLILAINMANIERTKKVSEEVKEKSNGSLKLGGTPPESHTDSVGQADPEQNHPRRRRSDSSEFDDSSISSNGSIDVRSFDGSEPSESLLDESDSLADIVIAGNVINDGSGMINAPVHNRKDWKDRSLRIQGNKASNGSFMMNHENSLEDLEGLVKVQMMWQQHAKKMGSMKFDS